MKTVTHLLILSSLIGFSPVLSAGETVLVPGPASAVKAWPAKVAVRGTVDVTDTAISLAIAEGTSPWRAVLRSPEASFDLNKGPLTIDVSGIKLGGIPGETGANTLFLVFGRNGETAAVSSYYPLGLGDGVSFNLMRKKNGYSLLVYPGRNDKVGEQRFDLSAIPTAFTLKLDQQTGKWTMTLRDAFFLDQDSASVTEVLPRSMNKLGTQGAYLSIGVCNWGETTEGTSATLRELKVVQN